MQNHDNEAKMTIWEHLEDLRRTLLKIIFSIALSSMLALCCSREIIAFLVKPSRRVMDETGVRLNLVGPFDAFWIQFKTGLLAGAILASPLVFYFAWQFAAPALRETEKRHVVRFAFAASLLFLSGVAAAYFSIPFLLSLTSSFTIEGTENIWLLSDFISFCSLWMLICGTICQTPLVIFALAKAGLVDVRTLRNGRPYAIVLIFIVAGVFTPPEPVSQIMMAVPLVFLYEISILLAKFAEPKKGETEDDQGRGVQRKPPQGRQHGNPA